MQKLAVPGRRGVTHRPKICLLTFRASTQPNRFTLNIWKENSEDSLDTVGDIRGDPGCRLRDPGDPDKSIQRPSAHVGINILCEHVFIFEM